MAYHEWQVGNFPIYERFVCAIQICASNFVHSIYAYMLFYRLLIIRKKRNEK